ncbi:Uu.00g121190.m01.CDS01 [Anthostomella pinea]|uniref:Large ribosomal subunit protein mL50 n=1 Tax=Anthostomella pinea TaxID=933095 RepID=A0AAI8YH71_9PEZI|nr:Uu.00g121190.m01.CDS01 [Anthostomella pinea]
MRRISRLRRPSGLPVPAAASRSSIAPQCPQATALFSSSSQTTIPSSSRRPTSTTLRQLPTLGRFYSSEKDPIPQSLSEGTTSEPIPTADEANWEDVPADPSQLQQIYVPPPKYTYATRPDEVSDPSYTPAATFDGLETVGGLGNWWDQQHWSKVGNFMGFKPRTKVTNPLLLEASVRRAVVEAFALRQAGREDDLTGVWPVGGQEELQRTMELDVQCAEDGVPSINGDISAIVDGLQWNDEVATEASAPPSPAVKGSVFSSEDILKFKEAWTGRWKYTSLVDPRFRFAVTKRIFQLTGHLVPDHQLSGIADVQTLLHLVQKPPKPNTLTEEIQKRRQDLVQLPNVSIATKRVTRGDKEKALGRFKLIEEELKKRDLPVQGHGGARKNREMQILQGGM